MCPLQSRHNHVTINSLQRWSLRIATTWWLRPGHNKCGYYNRVASNSPRPGHYEFTTTWPLQTCYYAVTTTPLQTRHDVVTTTRSLPPPGHYNLATTQPQPCYNTIPTTGPLRTHYDGDMVAILQWWSHITYCIIFSMSFHSFLTIKCHLTCMLHPTPGWL